MAGGRGLGRARVRKRRCAAAGVAAVPRRRPTCGDIARRSLACLAIARSTASRTILIAEHDEGAGSAAD
eukprot:2990800-Prymnesium_polylepis.1